MENLSDDKAELSLGFILETILLAEYSFLSSYLIYKTVLLLKQKQQSCRSLVLNFSLILSSTIRIVLFLPPQIETTNLVLVVDMFSASVCFFTSVCALISQWYDVYVLARWTGKFDQKYMMIKRFTLLNVMFNVFIWTMFIGMILFAEYFERKRLITYFLIRFLLIYDLMLSTILVFLVGSVGQVLKNELMRLVDGKRTRLTNLIVLVAVFTLLKFAAAIILFVSLHFYNTMQSQDGWSIYYFIEFNVCEISSMIIIHRTEKITSEIFKVSIAASYKFSSFAASSRSISTDIYKSMLLIK